MRYDGRSNWPKRELASAHAGSCTRLETGASAGTTLPQTSYGGGANYGHRYRGIAAQAQEITAQEQVITATGASDYGNRRK